MESLVVGLETAKKLLAAGFPQGHNNYYFYWCAQTGFRVPFQKLCDQNEARHYRNYPDAKVFAAPTAQEIADQLEPAFDLHQYDDTSVEVTCGSIKTYAPTMAEALALLWLKLQEGK